VGVSLGALCAVMAPSSARAATPTRSTTPTGPPVPHGSKTSALIVLGVIILAVFLYVNWRLRRRN
jgi:hypothetical protein